jgi:hypothetical protein
LEKKRIMELARAVVQTGRHPAVWKWESRDVIRKPGQDDYTELTAYSSISLLHCRRNGVEKGVAEQLAEDAERRGLLNDGQYGSIKRWSAMDAAALMVDRAQTEWREGHIPGDRLMDMKSAFPSIGRGRPLHRMRGKWMDGDLIQ